MLRTCVNELRVVGLQFILDSRRGEVFFLGMQQVASKTSRGSHVLECDSVSFFYALAKRRSSVESTARFTHCCDTATHQSSSTAAG